MARVARAWPDLASLDAMRDPMDMAALELGSAPGGGGEWRLGERGGGEIRKTLAGGGVCS
jgi:hypothetical protein